MFMSQSVEITASHVRTRVLAAKQQQPDFNVCVDYGPFIVYMGIDDLIRLRDSINATITEFEQQLPPID